MSLVRTGQPLFCKIPKSLGITNELSISSTKNACRLSLWPGTGRAPNLARQSPECIGMITPSALPASSGQSTSCRAVTRDTSALARQSPDSGQSAVYAVYQNAIYRTIYRTSKAACRATSESVRYMRYIKVVSTPYYSRKKYYKN